MSTKKATAAKPAVDEAPAAARRKARPEQTDNGEPAVEGAPKPPRLTKAQLERRIHVLQAQVAWLRKELGRLQGSDGPWWQQIVGSHADAPEAFEEAMRLGREWRESFRPKPRRRKSKDEDAHS